MVGDVVTCAVSAWLLPQFIALAGRTPARREQLMHQMNHPSKEQVRAYMRRREHARQPPPPPDEIRRQLAWCRVDARMDASAGVTPAGVAARGWHLSAEMARLSTLMAIAWLMHSGVAHRKN